MAFSVFKNQRLIILVFVFSLIIPNSYGADNEINYLPVLYPMAGEAPLVRHPHFVDYFNQTLLAIKSSEVSSATYYRHSIELLRTVYGEVSGLNSDESSEDLENYLLGLFSDQKSAVAIVDILAILMQEVYENKPSPFLISKRLRSARIKKRISDKLNQLIARAQSLGGDLSLSRPNGYHADDIFKKISTIYSSLGVNGSVGPFEVSHGFEEIRAELDQLVVVLESDFKAKDLQPYIGIIFRLNDSVQLVSQSLDNLKSIGSLQEFDEKIRSFDVTQYNNSRSAKHSAEQAEEIREFLRKLSGFREPMRAQLEAQSSGLDTLSERREHLERVYNKVLEALKDHPQEASSMKSVSQSLYHLIKNLGYQYELIQKSTERIEGLLPRFGVLESELGALAAELELRSQNFDPDLHGPEKTDVISQIMEAMRLDQLSEPVNSVENRNRRWLLNVYFGRTRDPHLDSQGALALLVANQFSDEELRTDLANKLQNVVAGNQLIYFRAFIELFPEDYNTIIQIISNRIPNDSDRRLGNESQLTLSLMDFIGALYDKYKENPHHFLGLRQARISLTGNRRLRRFPTTSNPQGLYLDELLNSKFQSESIRKLTCEFHIFSLLEPSTGENP